MVNIVIIQYTIEILNSDKNTNTLKLSVDNQSISTDKEKWWSVLFSPEILTLAPNSKGSVLVNMVS